MYQKVDREAFKNYVEEKKRKKGKLKKKLRRQLKKKNIMKRRGEHV